MVEQSLFDKLAQNSGNWKPYTLKQTTWNLATLVELVKISSVVEISSQKKTSQHTQNKTNFEKKTFGRIVKTAFHVSKFWKLGEIYKNSKFELKIFGLQAKKLHHNCQNCILRVHMNI